MRMFDTIDKIPYTLWGIVTQFFMQCYSTNCDLSKNYQNRYFDRI